MATIISRKVIESVISKYMNAFPVKYYGMPFACLCGYNFVIKLVSVLSQHKK